MAPIAPVTQYCYPLKLLPYRFEITSYKLVDTVNPLPSNRFENVRRRIDETANIFLPYENYIGSILGGQFRLGPLIREEPEADVYAIQTLDETDQDLETKAYILSDITKSEFRTRKRSMKRLEARQICSVDQAGRKFIVYHARSVPHQELVRSGLSTHDFMHSSINDNTHTGAVATESEGSQHTVPVNREFGNTKNKRKKRKRKRGLRTSTTSNSSGARQSIPCTLPRYSLSKNQHRSLFRLVTSDELSWNCFGSVDAARKYIQSNPASGLASVHHPERVKFTDYIAARVTRRSWMVYPLHELNKIGFSREVPSNPKERSIDEVIDMVSRVQAPY